MSKRKGKATEGKYNHKGPSNNSILRVMVLGDQIRVINVRDRIKRIR